MNFWQAWKGSNGTPWDQVKTGALTTIKEKNTKEERASETGTSDGGWDERENCYQRLRERAKDTKTKTRTNKSQTTNKEREPSAHTEGEREPELWAGLMGNKPQHHHPSPNHQTTQTTKRNITAGRPYQSKWEWGPRLTQAGGHGTWNTNINTNKLGTKHR